jgi:hypothetical protein
MAKSSNSPPQGQGVTIWLGFTVSRPWLTHRFEQAAGLLEPIYEAQLATIIQSRVIAMDETPIKAGRAETGKRKGGCFWPVYGEHDEGCLPCHPSRSGKHLLATLGISANFNIHDIIVSH